MLLKKAEQQSIEKPKIVEEKLKTSTPTAEKPASQKSPKSASIVGEAKESNKLLHHTSHKKANARTMSINNINEIQESERLNAKLTGNRHAVSNSLSSLNRPTASSKNSVDSNQLAHRSQPNLLIGNLCESTGETCSSSSTPDHLEQQFNQLHQFNDRLNKFNQLTHHLNQLKNQSTNPSPSSQYSPTNSVSATNDTDCSSVVNGVEMDKRVQSQNTENGQAHKKRSPQPSLLKNAQQQHQKQPNQHGGKVYESQGSLQKQKSVSFDPNVIENENNKAPKRISRSHKKKFTGRSEGYEPSATHRRRAAHHHSSGHSGAHSNRNSYQHDSYHHGSHKSNRRKHHYHYEDDDFCSTCSDSSCSSSSSVCSSSDEEANDNVDHRRRSGHPAVTCHGRKGAIKQSENDKLSQLAAGTKKAAGASSIAAEKMVELMQQQQLIIQQQLALQQMQPQSKQQRYLKNNTNESCVIS